MLESINHRNYYLQKEREAKAAAAAVAVEEPVEEVVVEEPVKKPAKKSVAKPKPKPLKSIQEVSEKKLRKRFFGRRKA